MARTVTIGLQDFEKVRTRNVFYVDKTDFIREWWETAMDLRLKENRYLSENNIREGC